MDASNLLKIAIQYEGKDPILTTCDVNEKLESIIQYYCFIWGLPNPENYALRFSDGLKEYLTDTNKYEITNGTVLNMVPSVEMSVTEVIKNIYSSEERHLALRSLKDLASQSLFVEEFVKRNGLHLMVDYVRTEVWKEKMLVDALAIILEITENSSLSSWQLADDSFITCLANMVTDYYKKNCNEVEKSKTLRMSESQKFSGLRARMSLVQSAEVPDTKWLRTVLTVIEGIISNRKEMIPTVLSSLSLGFFPGLLYNSDDETRICVLSLIYTIYCRADKPNSRLISKMVGGQTFRSVIVENVIGNKRFSDFDENLVKLLCNIQRLRNDVMKSKIIPLPSFDDPFVHERMKYMFKCIYGTDDGKEMYASFRKNPQLSTIRYLLILGFPEGDVHCEDLFSSKIGSLFLVCMSYFASEHSSLYTRLLPATFYMQQFPFGCCSLALVTFLHEFLLLGNNSGQDTPICYPMMFTHDCAFEECFSICIERVHKTWLEMRATHDDLANVMAVAQEQITRSITGFKGKIKGGVTYTTPIYMDPPMNFTEFKANLDSLSYSRISSIWQLERRVKNESERQSESVLQLRKTLLPSVSDMVKQERMRMLREGAKFVRFCGHAQRGEKQKRCFIRLSNDMLHLRYYEYINASGEDLSYKMRLLVSDLQEFYVGRDCQFVKDLKGRSKPQLSSLALSLDYRNSDGDAGELCLVASDEDAMMKWSDGINILLGRSPVSKLAIEETDMLLSMELNLRLMDLDTAQVSIPTEAPPLPPLPTNYDFVTKIPV